MSRPGPSSWIVSLCLLGLTFSQQAAETASEDGPRPNLGAPEAATTVVDVAELWEHPAGYLRRSVVMTVQLHSQLASWNPFLTRFGDGEYSAWHAWGDGQFPWVEAEYLAPRARVFARRGSSAEWALRDARRFERFELTGVVRSVFGGRPWFEVHSVKPLVRQIGEGCVIHASRGLDLMRKGAWVGALHELERAASEGLPAHGNEELERLMEVCRENLPLKPYRP
jgi:hypothetical protein